ncbi:MAG TPA: protein-disulfide reductase DsbD family protein [Bauldia sp.]|nr:protein-disulfide reductase DsbD family protein [Bauldia sp.]
MAASVGLLAAVAGAPARAATGDWAEGEHARARLVATPGPDGRLDAAIEIELAPGWKTYWRTPGDAGIAPVFDFSGSANLDGAVVRFPVPERHDDGFNVTNVYEGRVVLPVDGRLVDPAAMTEMRLGLDIGVCDEICIPVRIDADVALAPGETDPAAAEVVAAARAALPGAPAPGSLAADRITRVGGTDGKPVFEVAVTAPDPAAVTIFVEGPADWTATVPKLLSSEGGHARYKVKFSRLGAETPIEGSRFTVTLVSGGRSVEQSLPLD